MSDGALQVRTDTCFVLKLQTGNYIRKYTQLMNTMNLILDTIACNIYVI